MIKVVKKDESVLVKDDLIDERRFNKKVLTAIETGNKVLTDIKTSL